MAPVISSWHPVVEYTELVNGVMFVNAIKTGSNIFLLSCWNSNQSNETKCLELCDVGLS